MTTLGSLVVARRVATIAEVDEALARQVVQGGDLATCLLEVSRGHEPVLAALLAEAMGVEVAPVGELPRAADALLRLVPRAVVERHGLYPLEERNGELKVAVSAPLAGHVEEDLGFALGVRLRPCAAPLVRIRQALARDYGVPLDKRFARLLARLEGRDESVSRPPIAHPPSDAPPRAPSSGRAPARSAVVADATPASPVDVPFAATGPAERETVLVTLPMSPGRRRTLPGLPRPGGHPGDELSTVLPAPVAVPVRDHELIGAASGRRTLHPRFMSSDPPPPDGTAALPPASPMRIEDDHPGEPSAPPTPLTGQPLPAALFTDAARATAAQLEKSKRQRRESSPSRALAGWARRTLGNEIAADRAPEARKGPLTPADAERRIRSATKAENVLATYFAFARQYFEYAALFLVHGDLAEGHDSAGPGARRDQLRGVGVALDLPSILASARTRGAPVIGKLSRSGLDAGLRTDLARAPSAEVIVIPVVVRGRAVALLYGDDGDAPVELGDIGEVIAFGHLVAGALEHILVRRKRAALGQRSSFPPAADPAFSAAARAEVGLYVPAFSSGDGESDASASSPPELAAPEVIVTGDASVDVGLQELVGRDDHDPEFGGAVEETHAAPDQLGSASMSAEPQLPPQSRQPYRDLPPVLIRPELVDQVIGGGERGERALGEILALGEAAIPSVFARFPGPLTVDRRQPIGELPRPADCGPVLRIVAAMRRLALPFLAVRSGDADVEVRFWATYLLGELNYVDAGQALFPRLFDESSAVRKIAARAARNLLAAGEGGAPLRKSLERLVIYADEPESRREVAIATLAELRLYRSIPALIAALSDPSVAVSDGAARALAVLTRLELGHDAKKWRDWWESKGQKRLT